MRLKRSVACVWRHGYLRPTITGASGWRATGAIVRGKRREPGAATVRELWAAVLCRPPWRKFRRPDECTFETCFACGLKGAVSRAHILPRWQGGSDDACNLHLLCRMCHELSEGYGAMEYWKWFRRQTRADSIRYGAAKVIGLAGVRAIEMTRSDQEALASLYARGIDNRFNALHLHKLSAYLRSVAAPAETSG